MAAKIFCLPQNARLTTKCDANSHQLMLYYIGIRNGLLFRNVRDMSTGTLEYPLSSGVGDGPMSKFHTDYELTPLKTV